VEASNHVYTNDEILSMVKAKIGLNKTAVTEYSTAMEILEKKKAEAIKEKEYDALESIQKTIDR
jgi:hypothetical protein